MVVLRVMVAADVAAWDYRYREVFDHGFMVMVGTVDAAGA